MEVIEEKGRQKGRREKEEEGKEKLTCKKQDRGERFLIKGRKKE